MSFKIITISREFGSGGRFIGEQIAQKCGIEFYDKNIIAFSFFRFKSSYIVSNPCVSRLPRCYEKEKAL